MIPPSQTNHLFLSEKIKELQSFYFELENWIEENRIKVSFLKNTKDIWCRDYMPVQISENEFVQFKYNPSYLYDYQELKTNPDIVTSELNFLITNSELVVDGGNIICNHDSVIMTEMVFNENKKHFSREEVIRLLKQELKIDNLIFIPVESGDTYGHSDGMLQFVNKLTIVMNEYSKSSKLSKQIETVLGNSNFKIEKIPYEPSSIRNSFGDYTAHGNYTNYLEIGQHILFPQYGLKSDHKALNKIQNLLPEKRISTIDCNQLAEGGGVLNCISWAIKK